MNMSVEQSTPVSRYLNAYKNPIQSVQAEVLADLGRLNIILKSRHLLRYEKILKSQFQNSTFVDLHPGTTARRNLIRYTNNDPHVCAPFNFVNIMLINNVEKYLTIISGKHQF